jgi:TPR repeat protein
MRCAHPWLLVVLALLPCAQAADIGGWMQHKSRTDLPVDECTELIAQASRTPSNAEDAAQRYYASGLCYLHSDKIGRDTVAASAWLTRAAELEHPLARRALLSLSDSAPSTHAAGYHCHDLGLGRKICHGGPVRQ